MKKNVSEIAMKAIGDMVSASIDYRLAKYANIMVKCMWDIFGENISSFMSPDEFDTKIRKIINTIMMQSKENSTRNLITQKESEITYLLKNEFNDLTLKSIEDEMLRIFNVKTPFEVNEYTENDALNATRYCKNKILEIIKNTPDLSLPILINSVSELYDTINNLIINDNDLESSMQNWSLLCKQYYDRLYSLNGILGLLKEINKEILPSFTLKNNTDNITLVEYLNDNWSANVYLPILILGEGGTGKTFSLLNLSKAQLMKNLLSIYIPLCELNNNQGICQYLKNKVFFSQTLLDDLFKFLSNLNDPFIVLLLDGFNEIEINSQNYVMNEIKNLLAFPGIQIIITSRNDITEYYPTLQIQKLFIRPLDITQIINYLQDLKLELPTDSTLLDLLKIPLMLALYAFTAYNYPSTFNTPNNQNIEWNSGLIIKKFMECQVFKSKTTYLESHEEISYQIAVMYIAPYIAFKMEAEGKYSIDVSLYYKWLEEAVKNYHSIWAIHNFSHIKRLMYNYLNIDWNEFKIGHILENCLHIFYHFDNEYKLLHQDFRDCLSAMHLINIAEILCKYNGWDNNTTIDFWDMTSISHRVLKFISQLCEKSVLYDLWDNLKNRTHDTFTLNMIELFKISNITNVDFSYHNLKNICLVDFNFNNVDFQNSQISYRTFNGNGHNGPITALVSYKNNFISAREDIKLWDIKSRKLLKTYIGHKSVVNALSISPDNNHFASGSCDHDIRIWSLNECDNNIITSCRVLKGHHEKIWELTYINESTLVSSSIDGTIRIWDLESENCEGKILLKTKYDFQGIKYYPQKNMIFCWIRKEQFIYKIYLDSNTVIKERIVLNTRGSITRIEKALDLQIIIGDSFGRLYIYDLETMKTVKSWNTSLNVIEEISVYNSSYCACTGNHYDKFLSINNLNNGIEDYIIKNSACESISCICVNNEKIIIGYLKGDINVYVPKYNYYYKVAISQRNKITNIMYDIIKEKVVLNSFKIAIWDEKTSILEDNFLSSQEVNVNMYYSKDMHFIVRASNEKQIIFDYCLGSIKKVFYKRIWRNTINFISNSEFICKSYEGHFYKFNLNNGEVSKIIKCKPSSNYHLLYINFECFFILKDECLYYCNYFGYKIKIYNDTLRQIKRLDYNRKRKQIICGLLNGKGLIIDLYTFNHYSFGNLKNNITIVKYSPNNDIAVIGNVELILISLDNFKLVKLKKHTNGIVCVKFSLDSSTLFTASKNGLVVVWNTLDGSIKSIWQAHSDNINELILVEKTNKCITCSDDGTVKIWKLTNDLKFCGLLHELKILNANLIGSNFKGAVFEDENLKKIIKANGGIVE